MNISSKLNKLDGLMRSLTITVDKSEYINEFNKDLQKYKSTLKIDGFRTGKVPENIILKNYRETIHGNSINKIIEASLAETLSKNKLDTASPPSLSIESNPSFEQDLVFTAKFEIFPLFNIDNLEEIKIDVPEVNIDSAATEQVIDNIKKQHINWNEKTDNAAPGDKVIISYEGLIEGKSFDNNKQDNFTFIIDDQINGDPATVGLFKEFFEKTKGKSTNDKFSFTYLMPDSFADKKIAGKKITYNVSIKHVYAGDIPKLDEEFYKKFGPDIKDEKTFKSNIEKYMKVELDQKIKSQLSASINQELLDKNDFEIPKHMFETEVKNITSQYEGMKQSIDDSIKVELDIIATKRVKLNIIYMKITEDNNLSVTDKDVFEFISKSDESSQEQMIQKVKEDKKYLNHIKNKVLEDAIINLISEKCIKNKVNKKFSEVVN